MAVETRHPMNPHELKAWILRRCGAPQVKVELNMADLEDCIEDAVDWYISRKGLKKKIAITLLSGVVIYDVPEDVETVVDVAFPVSPTEVALVFGQYSIDDLIPYGAVMAPETGGIYSSIVQAVQYQEMGRRVLSTELNWDYDPVQRKIAISPPPQITGNLIVTYKSKNIVLEELPFAEFTYVRDYAFAQAKIKLGRIRSKYASFPGAQGTQNLDGPTLLEEAKAELERLNDLIDKSCYPLPFLTG